MLFVGVEPRLAHRICDVRAYALQKTDDQFWLILGHSLSKNSLRYTKRSRQSTSIGSSVSTSMSEKDQYKNRIELLQGTLDMGRWERIVEAIGSVMYVKPEESES